MPATTLGQLLHTGRSALNLSLQQTADRAGCSPGYIHKLEADKVQSPSPHVLSGLSEALGISYDELMRAAGYATSGANKNDKVRTSPRFSNMHIVAMIEELQMEVRSIRALLEESQT
jgi:transcriptional regulator with XRE-family HTH domain